MNDQPMQNQPLGMDEAIDAFTLLPGMNGVPFRLPKGQMVPLIKEDDPFHKRPTERFDGHVNVFDLSKPEQLKEYEEIVDKIAKGTATLSKEMQVWSEAKGSYMVFIRWLDKYLVLPEQEKESNGTSKVYH